MKDRIAEGLLALVTTPDRATSTVGDLMEHAGQRGGLWFWSSVLRTMGALDGAPSPPSLCLFSNFVLLSPDAPGIETASRGNWLPKVGIPAAIAINFGALVLSIAGTVSARRRATVR